MVSDLFSGGMQDAKAILSTFDSRLLQMKETSLHEPLQDDAHKNLLDCIDQKKARELFSAFKVVTEDLRVFLEKSLAMQKLLVEKPSWSEFNGQWVLFQADKEKLRTAVTNCRSFVEVVEQSTKGYETKNGTRTHKKILGFKIFRLSVHRQSKDLKPRIVVCAFYLIAEKIWLKLLFFLYVFYSTKYHKKQSVYSV